jgi:Family of unknown function (DUF6527)
MAAKVHEVMGVDGKHYCWSFRCPACGWPHQCDNRWTFNGDFEKPTFTGSVLVTGYEGDPSNVTRCHSFVKEGRIEYLGDCTHTMAGQTADIPDYDRPISLPGSEGADD